MIDKNIRETLKLFTLFGHLNNDAIELLVEVLEEEYFPVNSVVINQGDYGDKIYFIQKGLLEAYLINKHGEEVIIATLDEKNYFGELALFTDGFRNNSVRTKTACNLLSLKKEELNKLLDKDPSISRAFNTYLSQRLTTALHIVSEIKENIVILIVYHEESNTRITEFFEYFREISNKPIAIVDKIYSQVEFSQFNNLSNHYIFVKYQIHTTIPEFLIHKANFIINFVEEISGQICIDEKSNKWKIHNTARCIANKRVGIALCSGGVPGVAHLGVLKVLESENIPLDYIVGTSVGAILGGGYALGIPIARMIEIMQIENKKSTLMTILAHFSFNFIGIIRIEYMRKIFKNYIGEKKFSDTVIPFAAVSSDLYTGKTIVIKEGDIIEAIVASNAAAVIYEPVPFGDKILIDGVATAPLPIQTLSEEGMNIKIAVPIPQLELTTSITPRSKLLSIYLRSRSMMAEQMVYLSTNFADVIIKPKVENIRMEDWNLFDEIIAAGEREALIAIKKIKQLLYSNISK